MTNDDGNGTVVSCGSSGDRAVDDVQALACGEESPSGTGHDAG